MAASTSCGTLSYQSKPLQTLHPNKLHLNKSSNDFKRDVMKKTTDGYGNDVLSNSTSSSPAIENNPHVESKKVINLLQTRKSVFRRSISPSHRKKKGEQSTQNNATNSSPLHINKSLFNLKLGTDGLRKVYNSNIQNMNLSPIKKIQSASKLPNPTIPDARSVTTDATLKSWVKDMQIFQCGPSRQKEQYYKHQQSHTFTNMQNKYNKQIETQKSRLTLRKVDDSKISDTNELVSRTESYSSIDSPPLFMLKKQNKFSLNNQPMIIQSNNYEKGKFNEHKHLVSTSYKTLNTHQSSSKRRSISPPSSRRQSKEKSSQYQHEFPTISHERRIHSTKFNLRSHPLYDPMLLRKTPTKSRDNILVKRISKSDDHTSTTEDETLSSQELSNSICTSSLMNEKNQRSISEPRNLLYSRSRESYEALNDSNSSKSRISKDALLNNKKSTKQNTLIKRYHESNSVRDRIETLEATSSSHNVHPMQEEKSSLLIRSPSIVRDRVEMFDNNSRKGYFNINGSHSKIPTKNYFCNDDNRSQISHDTSSIVSDAVKELEQRTKKMSNKKFHRLDLSMKRQRNSSVSPMMQRKNRYLFQSINRTSNFDNSVHKSKCYPNSPPKRCQSASSAIKASNYHTSFGNNQNAPTKNQHHKRFSSSPPKHLWNLNLSPLLNGQKKYSNMSDKNSLGIHNSAPKTIEDGFFLHQKKENEKNDTTNLIFDHDSVYTNNSEYIPVVIPSKKILLKNLSTSKNNNCQGERRIIPQNQNFVEAKNKIKCIHTTNKNADQFTIQDQEIYNESRSSPYTYPNINKQSALNVDSKCSYPSSNSIQMKHESKVITNNDTLSDKVIPSFHSNSSTQTYSTTTSSFDNQIRAGMGGKSETWKGILTINKSQAISTKNQNGKKNLKSSIYKETCAESVETKKKILTNNIKQDHKESEIKSKINLLYNEARNSNKKKSLVSTSFRSQTKNIVAETSFDGNKSKLKGHVTLNNFTNANHHAELNSTNVPVHILSRKDHDVSHPMESSLKGDTETNSKYKDILVSKKTYPVERKLNVISSFKCPNGKNNVKLNSNNFLDTKSLDIQENSTSNIVNVQSKVDTMCNVNVKNKIITLSLESPQKAACTQEKSNEILDNKLENEKTVRLPKQYLDSTNAEEKMTNHLNSYRKKLLPSKAQAIENNERTVDYDPNIPLQVVVAKGKSDNPDVKESCHVEVSKDVTSRSRKSAVKRTIELMNKRRLRLQRRQCGKSFHHKCDRGCDDDTTLSSITNPIYGDTMTCCMCGHNVNNSSTLNTIQFLSLLEKPELDDDIHLISILNNLGEMEARTELINILSVAETSQDVSNKIESVTSLLESKNKASEADIKTIANEIESMPNKLNNNTKHPCPNLLLHTTQTSSNEGKEKNTEASHSYTTKVSNLNHSQERLCAKKWTISKNSSLGFINKDYKTQNKSLGCNNRIEVEKSKQNKENNVLDVGSIDSRRRPTLKTIDNVVDVTSYQMTDERTSNITNKQLQAKSKKLIECKQMLKGQNKKLSQSDGKGPHLDNVFKEQSNYTSRLKMKSDNKSYISSNKYIDGIEQTQGKSILLESQMNENNKIEEVNPVHTNILKSQVKNDLEKSVTATNLIRSKSEVSALKVETNSNIERLRAQQEQKVLSNTLVTEAASNAYNNVINGLKNCFVEDCYLENGIQNVVNNIEQVCSINQGNHILDEKKGDQLRLIAMKMRQKQRMLEKDENGKCHDV